MKKRITIFILALVLVFHLLPTTALAQRTDFADTSGHWVVAFLEALNRRDVEIFQGFRQNDNYYFRPNQPITRAQFAAVLVRLFDLHDTEAVSTFRDVSATAWYANYVASAAQADVVRGVDAAGTRFRPGAYVTRQEAMLMIARICLKMPYFDEIPESEWADIVSHFVDIGEKAEWAAKGAAFVVRHGIFQGRRQANGVAFLGAAGQATRAEVAAMMERMLNRIHIERSLFGDPVYVVPPEYDYRPQPPAPPPQPEPPDRPPQPPPLPPIPDTDKAALRQLRQSGNYYHRISFMFTTESFDAFVVAHMGASRVISNAWAEQDEIDAAYDALVYAINNLDRLPYQVYLRNVIVIGEVSEQLYDRFTPASHATMMDALNAARLLEQTGGTEQEHYYVARNLMDALRALRVV